MIRFLTGADGAWSAVFPSDIANAALFSYADPATSVLGDWNVNNPTYTGPRQIPIYSVRKYDVIGLALCVHGLAVQEFRRRATTQISLICAT